MHTAEHILNGTMVKMFGCKRSENCHIEKKKSKCDFILEKEPTSQQIKDLETKINEVIKLNLPVSFKFVDYKTASQDFKLRIKENDNQPVRIISVGDYDHCPCIGEHVQNTSEIGTFVITTTTFENNIFRIRFKLNP